MASIVKGRGLDYRTRNLVCKECLCYKDDKGINVFRDGGVASTNEDEG